MGQLHTMGAIHKAKMRDCTCGKPARYAIRAQEKPQKYVLSAGANFPTVTLTKL